MLLTISCYLLIVGAVVAGCGAVVDVCSLRFVEQCVCGVLVLNWCCVAGALVLCWCCIGVALVLHWCCICVALEQCLVMCV